jgi:hypothetical protein
MRRRRPRSRPTEPEPEGRQIDDREWSARPQPPGEGRELIAPSSLPAETGPTWAPDELSVWPVEGGRYGLDAHYHGRTGVQRAEHQRARLERANLVASVRRHRRGGATLRLGPLPHAAAWLALEAFLGRPLDPPTGAEVAPRP